MTTETTTKDTTYNGWTNYETWSVKLLIDNEQGSQQYWQEIAQEVYDQSTPRFDTDTKLDAFKRNFANCMKDEHESAMSDVLERSSATNTIWDQLLAGALSEVNWYEIAETYVEDLEIEDQS